MRLYECNICDSQYMDAYSVINCCTSDMKKYNTLNNKLVPGDIIVLTKRPFQEEKYKGQWLYMSITNEDYCKQLYPYFIVVSSSNDIKTNTTKYYLISNIFENNTTISIDNNYEFEKIPPEFVTNQVREVSKKFKKEYIK